MQRETRRARIPGPTGRRRIAIYDEKEDQKMTRDCCKTSRDSANDHQSFLVFIETCSPTGPALGFLVTH